MAPDPDSFKTGRALAHGMSISDWEHRAGRALWRQNAPDRIEATLWKWIEKGRREVRRNLPLMTVIGYAHARLPKDRMDDPAARRIVAMYRFSEGLRSHGLRIHHSYLDRLLEARRGGIYYQAEIEAGAFGIAEKHGWGTDPAEAYHDSLLAYLKKAGVETRRRRVLTAEDAEQYAHRLMDEVNEGFAREAGGQIVARRR